MSASERRVEDELVERVAQGATGVVDVRDGKKRWMFYLQDGALVWTRSNLKSEQAATLRQARPNMVGAALARAQALRSVRNAIHGGKEWAFKAGAEAQEHHDLPTLPLFHRALTSARSEEALSDALQALKEGWPRAEGALDDLGLPDTVAEYLATLDGARTGDEALGFAPGERGHVLAGTWLAWKLGRIVVEDKSTAAQVEPGLGIDIAALIADEVASPDDIPTFVPETPDDKPPEDEVPGHVVMAPPRVGGAPAPEPPAPTEPEPEDPIADRVRELHARVMVAEDHFQVFAMPWDSPIEDFRQAHLSLAQELHPDRIAGQSDELQDLATEAFDRVREAWEVLGDDEARDKYIDRIVHGKKTEEELAMEQVQNYWDAEADFKRGLAAFNAGRLVQAHEMFTSAIERVPDELEFRAYWAYTTYMTHRTRNLDLAVQGLDTLKEVLDRNKEQERKLDMAWVLLGRIYKDRNEDKVARRCFVQALRLNPSNSDASREMRRLTGGETKKSSKGGFLSGLFGKKKK